MTATKPAISVVPANEASWEDLQTVAARVCVNLRAVDRDDADANRDDRVPRA